MKRFLLALTALLASAALFAQEEPTGGVKGTVINRNGRNPVENAHIRLLQGANSVATVTSDADGTFLIPGLADGMYTLVIDAPDFLENTVQVTVNDGYVKNMFNISLTSAKTITEIDDDTFSSIDVEDTGFQDNPTILFGSNDVFENIAGYNFSAVRFRARGYSSESQDVYLAGVRLNDAITGYTPYSLWSGLNEAMRDKDVESGADMAEYGLGAYNGITNIFGTASHVRKGLRTSALTNNALYRVRLMATYSTGMMDNGWAIAGSLSARLGGNDWVDGVYYRSLAYYLAVDKRFNDKSLLSLVFFGAPGERGAQNASTQEVYDLVGNNMYNSNWGYQNGRVRNARVRKTHEPVAIIKYDYTPSERFTMETTLLARFGKNGYTALDFYDAQDPRPDYYRNLPSYFMDENPDMNRNNPDKYLAAFNTWKYASEYPNLTQIDWDRMYNVNRVQDNGRSKYIQEERHTDQRDLNFAINFKTKLRHDLDLNFGLFARLNYTRFYKTVADLLGGDYFLDIDNFAERDYAAYPYKLQNDLEHYLINGHAKKLGVGDKYGYDYAAQTRNVGHWWNLRYTIGNFSLNAGAKVSYDAFWREGFLRKGLFPGVDDQGNPFIVDGQIVPITYDNDGSVTTSKGKSKIVHFYSGAAKLGLNYNIGGTMRVYSHVGIYTDSPKFNQIFLSPRTRNTMVDDIRTSHTFSADINWQYSGNGINIRTTAFYTYIGGQSKVMSAYDDLQNTFSNFAITGIDQRHMGFEVGFKFPTYIVPNLSVQGAVALGDYVYTSTPRMTQTIDSSSELVQDNVLVPYWKATILNDETIYQRHHVPSTPQTAVSLGLSYNYNYWYIDLDAQYFDRAYLDMNPLYRTDYAVAGPNKEITDEEVIYMTSQEKFPAAFLLNLSVGKSWYIQRKYQLGFSLNAKNLLNNRNIKTGGYEQTRIVDNTVSKARFYRFAPKYFYMPGINYMLNIYFRF